MDYKTFERCVPTTNYTEIIDFVRNAHKDQMRNDGKTPYENHLFHVAAQAFCLNCNDRRVLLVGLAHDLFEDTNATAGEFLNVLTTAIDLPSALEVIQAVNLVTKYSKNDLEKYANLKQNFNYVDYLRRIKMNELARSVKIADLRHNISDLKEGNRKDKYALSLAYLENRL